MAGKTAGKGEPLTGFKEAISSDRVLKVLKSQLTDLLRVPTLTHVSSSNQ